METLEKFGATLLVSVPVFLLGALIAHDIISVAFRVTLIISLIANVCFVVPFIFRQIAASRQDPFRRSTY